MTTDAGGGRFKTRWGAGDTRRAAWVGVLPILFGVAVVVFSFVDESRSTPLGDALSLWYFLGVFGSVVYVPVSLLALLGAAALRRWFRFGRWLSTLGAVAVMLMCGLMVLIAVDEAVTDDALHPPYSWTAPLSPGDAVVFAVPYVLIGTVNVCLILRLWWRSGPAARRGVDLLPEAR